MTEVILKRFESPDEVRTFEKGKFEVGRHDHWPRHLRTGMALVRTRRQVAGAERMHGRTCGHGRFWLRNRGHEQWRRSRNASRAGVLRSARTRFMGRGDRALRFLAFFGRRRLCQSKVS